MMGRFKLDAINDFVGKRKIAYITSSIILLTGLASLLLQGLNLGIDFTGGTVLRIDSQEELRIEELREGLEKTEFSGSQIQAMDHGHYQIKTEFMSQEEQDAFLAELSGLVGEVSLVKGDSVGPSMGKEILQKGIIALVVAIGLMIAYISFRFEWRFALAGILALLHDILLTVGIFSIFQLEVNSAFIAALLTIFGYSINDSIVIFDRIRENLGRVNKNRLPELVNYSVSSTFRRSIYTSVSTLLPLIAVFALGGETTQMFTLAMIIGIAAGAYSSIFIAAPLWLDMALRGRKKIY